MVGQAGLRQSIARHHARLTGHVIDPGRVVVLAGAQSALFTACQCLLEPGDEVLVPEPMYVTYPATVAAAGARIVAGAPARRARLSSGPGRARRRPSPTAPARC